MWRSHPHFWLWNRKILILTPSYSTLIGSVDLNQWTFDEVWIISVTLRFQIRVCRHVGTLWSLSCQQFPFNQWDDLWNVTAGFSQADFTRNLLHLSPCRCLKIRVCFWKLALCANTLKSKRSHMKPPVSLVTNQKMWSFSLLSFYFHLYCDWSVSMWSSVRSSQLISCRSFLVERDVWRNTLPPRWNKTQSTSLFCKKETSESKCFNSLSVFLALISTHSTLSKPHGKLSWRVSTNLISLLKWGCD